MRQLSANDDAPFWEYLGDGKDGDRAISASVAHSCANVGGSGTALAGQNNVDCDDTATPPNGDVVVIHQTIKSGGITTENWELNVVESGGGTASLRMKYPLQIDYVDDGADNQFQIMEVKEYNSLTFSSSAVLECAAWDGNKGGILPILCRGSISGTGGFLLTGHGYRGGNLRGGDGGPFSGAGEGDAGLKNKQQQANNGNGGGGGNHNPPGNRSGGGGGGGNGTSGYSGGEPLAGHTPSLKGYGGSQDSGTDDLVAAIFGGGGGHQGTAQGGGATYGPEDVNDGGGLAMLFGQTIDFSSLTLISNGQNGFQDDDQNGYAAGAGGSALLVGEVITLGTNKFTVNGGAQGGPGFDAPLNGAGGLGRLYARYKTSITGSNASPAFGSEQDQLLLPYDTSDIF